MKLEVLLRFFKIKNLKLLSLVFFIAIFSCQIYIQTIQTKSNLEKWDIDYNQIKYEISNMAIDSEGNLYVTNFENPNLYGLTKPYKKGTILDEKIFKITPEGKVSEFFIYDEFNKVVNIFPKRLNKDSDIFISSYESTNLIIKNDYLYASYQYIDKPEEKGFLKFNLKNSLIDKFPREILDYKFIVNDNDEIKEYNRIYNHKTIIDKDGNEISIPNIYITPSLYTNTIDSNTFKIDKNKKINKINLNTIDENIFNITNKVESFISDSNNNIFFIDSKYNLIYEKRPPFPGYIRNYERSNLYKITDKNDLSLLFKNIGSYKNISLDEKRQILYFSDPSFKYIYKIKL